MTYFLLFFRIPLVVNCEAENIQHEIESSIQIRDDIITLMVSHIAKFQRVTVTRFKRILGFEQIRSRVVLVVQTFAEV